MTAPTPVHDADDAEARPPLAAAAQAVWAVLRRAPLGLIVVLALLLGWWAWSARAAATTPPLPSRLALVLPDGWQATDPQVLAWQDAADELGFTLELVGASELLRNATLQSQAALILPDTLHRRMNDALLAQLQRLVEGGTRLMLVHDAGIADLSGNYHPQQSRLSALAGVRYGRYGELKTGMLREQEAWVEAAALPLLRLPPGKLMREDSDRPLTSAQPAPQAGEELAVVGYHYGRLKYPIFATAPLGEAAALPPAASAAHASASGADAHQAGTPYPGTRLMHGDGHTVLAGVHRVGRGQVLFVNLPLTYLKLRTDGLFLHSFLLDLDLDLY